MNPRLPLLQFWNFPLHPPAASTFADEVDVLYFALVALTVVFTLIVFAMVIFFAFRYRRGAKVDRSNPLYTSHFLELSWSIIPLILALFIFAWGAKLYADVYKPPDNAREIYVIGKQWMWHMQHTNGVRENNELHVPVGQPVKLTMISQDVLHAFYIPEFRLQKFVNPGQYTSMWFTATKPGKYHIFCNQYCGAQHSLMGGYVYAMEPAEFERWLATNGYKGGDVPTVRRSMEEEGAELYQSIGCGNCHNANNNRRGPSLYGIYGSKRQLTTGETVIADRDYLREAIVNPGKRITAGYENIMPEYASLKEEQINSLIAYMKSLGTAQEPKLSGGADTGVGGGTMTAPSAGRKAPAGQNPGARPTPPTSGSTPATNGEPTGAPGQNPKAGSPSAAPGSRAPVPPVPGGKITATPSVQHIPISKEPVGTGNPKPNGTPSPQGAR